MGFDCTCIVHALNYFCTAVLLLLFGVCVFLSFLIKSALSFFAVHFLSCGNLTDVIVWIFIIS